jgi:vancomycin resistance protein VanW
MKRPRQRSRIRLVAGKIYYTLKKYYYWYFSGTKFSESIDENRYLPFKIFTHQTILLRKLCGLDTWMQKNKVINLKIATKKLNGLIINPGETFSYWRQLGRATKKKGYLAGMVLRDGIVAPGIGGGLCQLSNLIFWMTLYTPPHGYRTPSPWLRHLSR